MSGTQTVVKVPDDSLNLLVRFRYHNRAKSNYTESLRLVNIFWEEKKNFLNLDLWQEYLSELIGETEDVVNLVWVVEFSIVCAVVD